jgi:hypothetical protein
MSYKKSVSQLSASLRVGVGMLAAHRQPPCLKFCLGCISSINRSSPAFSWYIKCWAVHPVPSSLFSWNRYCHRIGIVMWKEGGWRVQCIIPAKIYPNGTPDFILLVLPQPAITMVHFSPKIFSLELSSNF